MAREFIGNGSVSLHESETVHVTMIIKSNEGCSNASFLLAALSRLAASRAAAHASDDDDNKRANVAGAQRPRSRRLLILIHESVMTNEKRIRARGSSLSRRQRSVPLTVRRKRIDSPADSVSVNLPAIYSRHSRCTLLNIICCGIHFLN